MPQLGGASVEVSVRFTVDAQELGWSDAEHTLGVAGIVDADPVVAVVVPDDAIPAGRTPFVPGNGFDVQWPLRSEPLNFEFSLLAKGLVAVVSPFGIHALIAVGDRLADFESASFGTYYDNRFVPLYNNNAEEVWMAGWLNDSLMVAAAFSSPGAMQRAVEYQPMPAWRSTQLVDLGVWDGTDEQLIFVDWGYNIRFAEV